MKIIIKEDKLKNSLEKLIQSTFNSFLNDEEYFDSYELDILNSIDRVEISHITTGIGITVWLNIYSKINENFDFLTSELQYKLKNLIPNIKIFTNDVITLDDEDFINEMIKLNIKVGDTLMGGKFKNKKVVVKTIGKNDKGDITINGKPLLRFRMLKENVEIPENKNLDMFKKWLYNNYPNISFLEVTRKKDPYLYNSRFKDIPLVIVHYTESDEGEYPTWKPNYRSWLVINIVETWNTITGGSIPITGSFYDRIDHKNVKILVDAEEFSEDEEESINESVNPKMIDLFDGYIKKVHPEFLVKNTTFRMSSGEDTLYIYCDNSDGNCRAEFFIDLSYYDEVDGKHLYFYNDKYIEEFSNIFGDNWAELFLDWVNKEYEPKLKLVFNELEWKITGVD
jgi:hypothetical protein